MEQPFKQYVEKEIRSLIEAAGMPERFVPAAVAIIEANFTASGVMPRSVHCFAGRNVRLAIDVPRLLQDIGNGLCEMPQ